MKHFLGIELGSTRIKAVLIDENYRPIAQGSHDWENRLLDGVWTYSLDEVWQGLAAAVQSLKADAKTGEFTVDAIGVSAMMHGYLAFDREGRLLAPFRTWRNTMTEKAAAELTALLGFNIPQRWSAAHLYQAILNGEDHVKDIAFLTTLAGYVHWKLTGEKVIGIGDASGMFPIDSGKNDFDQEMLRKFDGKSGLSSPLKALLPRPLLAGEKAGALTPEGALLLDPSGGIPAGVPLCPPEGDAGTGMTATNSVAPRTGNVSAGTSIFAMIVLEKPLSGVYPEIDMVTTPTGKPVAMVHCNSCTTDLDAWVRLLGEAAGLFGAAPGKGELYDALYYKALEGDADCGGLLSYNFYAGEPVVAVPEGRPLFVRQPDSAFTLANFLRCHLYGTMAALKLGMNILTEREKVRVERLQGHGGLFKTKGVGQRFMAAALGVPVAVMESAGEGGAWGIALLAAYMAGGRGLSLEAFLEKEVFAGNGGETLQPDRKDAAGFAEYIKRWEKTLAVEKTAGERM